jgi:hypothetical protein
MKEKPKSSRSERKGNPKQERCFCLAVVVADAVGCPVSKQKLQRLSQQRLSQQLPSLHDLLSEQRATHLRREECPSSDFVARNPSMPRKALRLDYWGGFSTPEADRPLCCTRSNVPGLQAQAQAQWLPVLERELFA